MSGKNGLPYAELESLRADYASGLPMKTAELLRALNALVHALGMGETVTWTELEYFTHKLHGSSGTYGFDRLAAVTGYLEDRLTDGSLAALNPRQTSEHLAQWSAIFTEQARLASELKPSPLTCDALVTALKTHYEALVTQRTAA